MNKILEELLFNGFDAEDDPDDENFTLRDNAVEEQADEERVTREENKVFILNVEMSPHVQTIVNWRINHWNHCF